LLNLFSTANNLQDFYPCSFIFYPYSLKDMLSQFDNAHPMHQFHNGINRIYLEPFCSKVGFVRVFVMIVLKYYARLTDAGRIISEQSSQTPEQSQLWSKMVRDRSGLSRYETDALDAHYQTEKSISLRE